MIGLYDCDNIWTDSLLLTLAVDKPSHVWSDCQNILSACCRKDQRIHIHTHKYAH